MSEKDKENREWRFYIDDMIKFAENAISYTNKLKQYDFVEDGLVYDATLRNLELIGEAATHIPDDIRKKHLNIPWRLIIATRNCLIHAYLGIDNDTVWSIIVDDLEPLLESLQSMRKSLDDDFKS